MDNVFLSVLATWNIRFKKERRCWISQYLSSLSFSQQGGKEILLTAFSLVLERISSVASSGLAIPVRVALWLCRTAMPAHPVLTPV